MEFHTKLPRTKKESVLFLAIVSGISVNIIAPLITCFEMGFHLYVWAETLTVIPFIWLAVIALVLLTYKPAEFLTYHVAKKTDSFGSQVLINILFAVLLMSMFLTVAGSWIGTRTVNLEPIKTFPYKWPRNFSVALFVETCIAQPIARYTIQKIHFYKDSKS